MANKYIEINFEGESCIIELFIDKAPNICKMILDNLPLEGIVQHALLNGQLVFTTLPFTCGFENKCPGGDLTTGDVAFYNPRNQLCILYGRCTDEPLPISHIGRIVKGMDRIELAGMRNWMRQGGLMQITAAAESTL